MKEDILEVELGKVFNITYGKGLPTKKLTKEGFPVFGANGVIGFYTEYKYEEKQVLISCRGAASGKINISPEKCFITNNSLVVESNSELILKKFLYFILSGANRSQIVTGSAQPQVTINNANTLLIKLAPLPIQRAIVSKIEALFSDLDNGIANLKKAQEQLKVYRQAVLKKAFEGGFSITNEEFRITNSENQSSDNLPKGWKWVKLGEVALKIGSGSTPKGGQENYKTEGIPLIRSMNIYFEYIKYEGLAFIDENQAKKLNNVIVYENDILLNITGASIGRVNLAPKQFNNARVNQHVSIIRLNDSDFNPKFIKYFIQSPKIQDWINSENYGATRQALSKNMIENIVVPKLKLQEQTQIVQEIESRLSVTDNLEIVIRNSIEKAEALRQSILKKAFEGKLLSEAEIEQCKAAADYEPASKLLKKIQAEKLAKEQEKKKKPTVKKKIPKG